MLSSPLSLALESSPFLCGYSTENTLRISLLPHTWIPSPFYLPLVDEDDLVRSTNHEPPDDEICSLLVISYQAQLLS